MTTKQHKTGFTIVELMVTLAIAAVLLGMALPAFNGLMAQRTMTSEVNDFVLAVHYARSEAAKLGGLVSVQAVDATDDDNEWGPGWCVVIGAPGNCNAALRVFNALDAATLDADGDLDTLGTISFNSRGLMTLDGNGSLSLCSTDASVNPGRTIDINNIGRTTSRELVCVP